MRALMPRAVATAIDDLLTNCAEVKPGQRVVIVAANDGLTGGDNVVDEATIHWIQAGVQQRGAHPTVLWTDVPGRLHDWHVPPVLKAAVAGADRLISHAFDLPSEEQHHLLNYIGEEHLVIGSDSGHNDPSKEPEFVKNMRAREDLAPAVIENILCDNPRRLYGVA